MKLHYTIRMGDDTAKLVVRVQAKMKKDRGAEVSFSEAAAFCAFWGARYYLATRGDIERYFTEERQAMTVRE